MKIEELDNILEALLFVAGDGLSINEICDHLDLQKSEINASIARLKTRFGGKKGIHLITYNNKLQFGSNPVYKEQVAVVLNPIKEKELSGAALETIAIVAYKQPITRLEIETIRGVNADYAISVLLNHKLVEVVGRRDAVGKPLLFGTTEAFLKRFRLESVAELPDYEQLLESIKIIEDKYKPISEVASLYNEFEISENGSHDASKHDDEFLPEEEELPDFLENETNLQKIE